MKVVQKRLSGFASDAFFGDGRFKEYFESSINRATSLVDVDKLGVLRLELTHRAIGRAVWSDDERAVVMYVLSKSFHPDYRGYSYKKFGGRADLTPGGVFLHECGHAFSFRNRGVIREFKAIRSWKRKSITSYASGNVYEDIAECFRLYVSNGALLKRLQPERYEAIHKYGEKYLS